MNETRRKTGNKKATKATLFPSAWEHRTPREIRMARARRDFLEAFERTFGNVVKSCQFAGINRSTFYRWLESDSPEHVSFRRRLKCTNPDEFRKDIIEGKFMELVQKGNASAILLAMRTYCADRLNRSNRFASNNDRLLEDVQRAKRKILEVAKLKGCTYREELKNVVKNLPKVFPAPVLEYLINETKRRKTN